MNNLTFNTLHFTKIFHFSFFIVASNALMLHDKSMLNDKCLMLNKLYGVYCG